MDLSGAPRSLLNIVRSLGAKHELISIGMIDGPLKEDYISCSKDVFIVRNIQSSNKLGRIIQKIIDIAKLSFCLVINRPDVIIINTMSSLRAQLVCFALNIPYVVYVRETDGMIKGGLSYLRKKALIFAGRVFCVSNANRDFVLSIGVNANKILTIPNGLDSSEITNLSMEKTKLALKSPKNKSAITIGICGTMCHRKGFDYFYRTAEILLESNIDAQFIVIGEFETTNTTYKNEWMNVITKSSIVKHINITGFVVNPYPYIAALDILLMPSRHESLPRCILEACALRKPVVAFDVGGTAELLPPSYPFLIPFGEFEKFVQSVIFLTKNREDRLSIGDELFAFASLNFSQSQVSNEIECCLKSMLN